MRILLATDLSSSADHAATLARSLALPAGSRLRIVAVLEPAPVFLAGFGPVDIAVSDPTIAAEGSLVNTLADTFRRPELAVEAVVRVGRAATEIVAEARDLAADLIVMGSRGRGPFATALLGSVAAEVVDHAPCPVLVARTDTLRSLVLADDGSDGARFAHDIVTSWPFLSRAAVRVVSVVDVPYPWFAGLDTAGVDAATMQAYFEGLDKTRADQRRVAVAAVARLVAGGVRARAEIREGDAAGELVASARENGDDVVVLGSRGLTGITRIMLGGVARNVLLHAPCSVLIARRAARVEAREAAVATERVRAPA